MNPWRRNSTAICLRLLSTPPAAGRKVPTATYTNSPTVLCKLNPDGIRDKSGGKRKSNQNPSSPSRSQRRVYNKSTEMLSESPPEGATARFRPGFPQATSSPSTRTGRRDLIQRSIIRLRRRSEVQVLRNYPS